MQYTNPETIEFHPVDPIITMLTGIESKQPIEPGTVFTEADRSEWPEDMAEWLEEIQAAQAEAGDPVEVVVVHDPTDPDNFLTLTRRQLEEVPA